VIHIEPYLASHQVWRSNDDGTLRQEWQACRVMGIAMKNDEPVYLIETYEKGDAYLELVNSVRAAH
jgi:hypothetical protein